MICFVAVLDTLTVVLHTCMYFTLSPSLWWWVMFCMHSQCGFGWSSCANCIWKVTHRDSTVTSSLADEVVLMLWSNLPSHSNWSWFSGVVYFPETVEALGNENQVRIWNLFSFVSRIYKGAIPLLCLCQWFVILWSLDFQTLAQRCLNFKVKLHLFRHMVQ